MLEPHGEITRLFLQEEGEKVSLKSTNNKLKIITHPSDHIQRKKRMASGGNGTKQFVEGWIEFSDKKVAKHVRVSP